MAEAANHTVIPETFLTSDPYQRDDWSQAAWVPALALTHYASVGLSFLICKVRAGGRWEDCLETPL